MAINNTKDTVAGSNKKYPDVPMFNGDRKQWDSWRLHLYTKFRVSAMLYPSEKDKIDYIRDYCGEIPFNIIKAGFMDEYGKIGSDYCYYQSTEEIINLLDNLYRTYDPMAEVDAELHDPNFCIKNYETFDSFLAKFTAIVAPLALTDI